MQTENQPQRITKLMSQRGMCSRREAEEFIDNGWVYVDGIKVTVQGFKAYPHQEITLSGSAQTQQNQKVTILLNKPIGYVSGQPEDNYEPAVRLISEENEDPNFKFACRSVCVYVSDNLECSAAVYIHRQRKSCNPFPIITSVIIKRIYSVANLCAV
jgi:ribosomal protein S4